jgi:anion-transporting  ArsA/GET3 family ATPase
MNLSSKRLIFVTGKGGVGKSVCAAAIAWKLSRQGAKVCLFELGNQSFYESFFETRGIGYEPVEVLPDVHISLLTAESALREYVTSFLKVPKLYDIFFQNKVMKAFLNAAPALSELSILGKLTSEIRGIFEAEYDVFIVDGYSTGHAMALFHAPAGLTEAFHSGPLADQSRDIDRILKNPELTHYVMVSLPEEMPVTESEELYAKLKTEFNADVTLICNQLVSPPVSRPERDELKKIAHDPHMNHFIDYLDFKETIQNQQLVRLEKIQPEFYGVPQILSAARGQVYVEKFAAYLEKPWALKNS